MATTRLFGASVLGDSTSTTLLTAALTAIEQLFAWKFTLHGIPATGRVQVDDKTFNRVSGRPRRRWHYLPRPAAERQARSDPSADAGRLGSLRPAALSRRWTPAGPPTSSATLAPSRPPAWMLPVWSSPWPLRSRRPSPAGWHRVAGDAAIVLSPDVTGDGVPDLLASVRSTGRLRVYAGDGSGGRPVSAKAAVVGSAS